MAWGGWSKLVDALENKGYPAVAIDLPGHEKGGKPGWGVSLSSYVNAVIEAASKIEGDVHLVGHSLGGISLSTAAERAPEYFASLTYITALMLNNENAASQTRKYMPNSLLVPPIVKGSVLGGVSIDREAVKEPLYMYCSDEDVARAKKNLCSQPIRSLLSKISVSEERWGTVPRYYIFCERDQAIPIEHQRRMEARLPCLKTTTIDTDHSPFVSEPEATAQALIDFVSSAEVSS